MKIWQGQKTLSLKGLSKKDEFVRLLSHEPEEVDYTLLYQAYSAKGRNPAAEKYEPSVVARYIISLAAAFNKFYHECPILQTAEDIKKARLYVVNLVQLVIKDACSLLGMKCPEEM